MAVVALTDQLIIACNMQIDLSYSYAAMTQDDTQHLKISAVNDIKSSESMSEQMAAKPIDPGPLLKLLHYIINCIHIKNISETISEERLILLS